MAKETVLAGINPCMERKMHPVCDCEPHSSLAVANCSLQHEAPTILRVLESRGKATLHVLRAGAKQEEAFAAVGA